MQLLAWHAVCGAGTWFSQRWLPVAVAVVYRVYAKFDFCVLPFTSFTRAGTK
jgi:hypothetical protein